MNGVKNIGRKIKMLYFKNKYRLHNVHPTFYMGGKSSVSSDFKAGPYSYVGPGCLIYPNVEIGAYTMLANNVSIIGGDHRFNIAGCPMIFSGREKAKKTIIGKDCWIGAFSIIMAGVTIGDGAIVAAGSVVSKDVAPYSIYGGVPAKKIKDRFSNESDIIKHTSFLSIPPEEIDPSVIHFAKRL